MKYMVRKLKTSVSAAGSLTGWNFKKWIAGNAETIKIVIGAVVAIGAANPNSILALATTGVGVIGVKAILDIVDFYRKEVAL